MSERKKKRGRPRVAPMLSYGNDIKIRNNISRTIKKPKYLRDNDESFGNSGDGDIEASLASGSSGISTPKSKHSKISLTSRNSRGFNSQLAEDKDSEYHYGSDFDSEDGDAGGVETNQYLLSDNGSISDGSADLDIGQDGDDSEIDPTDPNVTIGPGFVPFWKLGPAGTFSTRAQTPIPVWLRDTEYPLLELPKSSEDLLMPHPFVLQAVSIYEVLRHFRTLLRLTPFRFEDFCAAMICEEQTSLISEIHISLLKALIREEECQQTHFGPLDQKDSINITLFFIDAITWPTVLRQFLQSDGEFKQALEILDSCNYPFSSLNNRLQVLQFLTDQYLQTTAIRDHLNTEGKIHYDDHCRVCHKTGDLLCCDSCTAVYHLECTDPPLRYAPSESEDWTCNVCKIHQVDGVTECSFSMESSGAFCRQDPLGYDRHGRKYWFITRRIFVESDDGDVWYYSNPAQLDCLFTILDSADLEEGLCICLKEYEDEIRSQMETTQTLTEKFKGSRIAYLTIERGESLKSLKELKDEQIKREEELMAEIKREKDEMLLQEKEELKKESDLLLDSMIEEVKEEIDVEKSEIKIETVSTEIEIKDESIDIKEEIDEKKSPTLTKAIEKKPKMRNFEGKMKVYDEQILKILTKEKSNQFTETVGLPFRLGCDLSNRSYVNQYTSNVLTLNKLQHQEEKDKKRHLSHKFSFGPTASTEFKWSGSLYGTHEQLMSVTRQSVLSIEQSLSSHLFHPIWSQVRKKWCQIVSTALQPAKLGVAISILVACIKPIVFSNVWHESLGHGRLKRITLLEREEKKKQERKEKKENEEEQRYYQLVKYTKKVRHSLWKMKGEEYRIHGLWGWLWLSSTRIPAKTIPKKTGLAAGPDKIIMAARNPSGVIRGLPINTVGAAQFQKNNAHLKPSIFSPKQLREMEEDSKKKREENGENVVEEEIKRSEIIVATGGVHEKLEVIPIDLENYFEDGVINVSAQLNAKPRFVYPKLPKGSTYMDSFLARRVLLKNAEEKDMANKLKGMNDMENLDIENDSDSTLSDASDNENVDELPDSHRSEVICKQRPAGHLLKEMRTHKIRYEALDKTDEVLPCYSPSCRGSSRSNCYSPGCLLKERTKQKLVDSVNSYKIITNKPAPFDHVGSCSPVRFDDNAQSAVKSSSMNKSQDVKVSKASNGRALTPTDGVSQASSGKIPNLDDDSESNSRSSSDQSRFSVKNEYMYTAPNPEGKVYLKKSYSSDTKRAKKFRIPQISTSRINKSISEKSLSAASAAIRPPRQRFSIFVLPQYELKMIARKGGQYHVTNFSHNAKTNNQAWPYPTSRPAFKLFWLFRNNISITASSLALQLRIMWSCLRWEDIQEKGTPDGRRQITTDAEIVQTEILKRKYVGRFLEKTMYLQRKVTILLDVQAPVREFTPSQRSGLRKRRRAQSPVNSKPECSEDWVEEEKIEIWEIKYFGDSLEKVSQNRRERLERVDRIESISIIPRRSESPMEFKIKMEEQLKLQRANFMQKKQLAESSKNVVQISPGNALTIVPSVKNLKGTKAIEKHAPIPTGRKIVTTKGGKIITVQGSPINQDGNKITMGNSSIYPISMPKVQVVPGNKVIRLQNIGGTQRAILPRSSNMVTSTGTGVIVNNTVRTVSPIVIGNQTQKPIMQAGQQIHIVKLADGQLQVRGLQDGQQLVQRVDGKLHLINANVNVATSVSVGTKLPQNPIQVTQLPKNMQKITPVAAGQLVKINGQQVMLRPAAPTSNVKLAITADTLMSANTPKCIAVCASPQQNVLISSAGHSVKMSMPQLSAVKPYTNTVNTAAAPIPSIGGVPKINQPITTAQQQQVDQNLPNVGNSLALKVQVRMTEQGPKTIIQGLQPGVGLTKEHIVAIQAQVRNMLEQYNLEVGQLTPLMTLTLHVADKAQQPSPQKTQSPFKEMNSPMKKIDQKEAEKIPTGSPLTELNKQEKISKLLEREASPNKKFVLPNDFGNQALKDDKFDRLQNLPDAFDSRTEKGTKRLTEQDDYSWDSEHGGQGHTKKVKLDKVPKSPRKLNQISPIKLPPPQQQKWTAKKNVKQQKFLEILLARHKDLLKKDILKKRAILEKELQLQIHKELTVARQVQIQTEKKEAANERLNHARRKQEQSQEVPAPLPVVHSEPPPNKKSTAASERPVQSQRNSPNKNNHLKNTSAKQKISKGRSKKIVCICRTPFDDTKFYVGCDLCGNWFHGQCVGITEAISRTMSEYICDVCANAKLNKELFCLCKQPYDELQFYICCEKCEDWYHGKCIGIMQAEADDIDDYICPKCDPNNVWNKPCQKKLANKDYQELKKIARGLVQHKNAWPFLEPVDKSEVPDYYKVVKKPMDLKTIEKKVNSSKYTNVAGFVGDVMLVLDNCRAYNPPNSSFCSCAHALELYFCAKLKLLKQKVSGTAIK